MLIDEYFKIFTVLTTVLVINYCKYIFSTIIEIIIKNIFLNLANLFYQAQIANRNKIFLLVH